MEEGKSEEEGDEEEAFLTPACHARTQRIDSPLVLSTILLPDLERAWGQDPIVLVETEGTREVHAEHETVN